MLCLVKKKHLSEKTGVSKYWTCQCLSLVSENSGFSLSLM